VLLLACEMGVLNLGTVALDGTKIHANASRHSALSYEHAGKLEAQLKAEVEKLLAKAEAADKADEEPDAAHSATQDQDKLGDAAAGGDRVRQGSGGTWPAVARGVRSASLRPALRRSITRASRTHRERIFPKIMAGSPPLRVGSGIRWSTKRKLHQLVGQIVVLRRRRWLAAQNRSFKSVFTVIRVACTVPSTWKTGFPARS